MKPQILTCLFLLVLAGTGVARQTNSARQKKETKGKHFSAENVAAFEEELESLRIRYHIPSISVGVVHHKELKWHKGFGYADIEKKIVPDEHTIYHLASVTKTFGAIILMRLVEQGKISLDDPVTKYGIKLGARWNNDSRIKLKHLLTHSAQGGAFNSYKPGYEFRYQGD
jgi:CubicO group peptidase (beta-lactamase class C family)